MNSLATFFSHVMSAIGGNTAGPGDSVVNVYINHEKKFAFLEMRSVEEASNAMALDGIILEGAPSRAAGLLEGPDRIFDISVTDTACEYLNGIKLGDKTLTVRRADQGTSQLKPEQDNVLLHALQQIALQRFIKDEDNEDILENMRIECGKYGTSVNVVIPWPKPNGEPSPGVGKVSVYNF
ncbi:hypothetical protein F0562_006427 [Nyssa sinensis]|uniref:RRM domain-containing protein n=1 Tax=Nyssa sinensis TaxID=561372 RepID=A0A5J5APZ3_9ASTE|nr:hypothetical protein F0562_006427 [Nyssa sinensis]